MKFLMIAISLFMMACAPATSQVTAAPAPAPVVDHVQADIDSLLKEENDYRLSQGDTMLSSGLTCTLSTVTGGERIQATSGTHIKLTGIKKVATYLLEDTFNQADVPATDGLSILPSVLRSYTNLFLLTCEGHIVIRESGTYGFDLTSDDASLLKIDGVKVVDNDNAHGATTVSGQVSLRRGVHEFRLDFAQTGGGNQALILKMNGSLLDPKIYAH